MDRKALLDYLGDDWTRTQSLIRSTLGSDIKLLNDTNDYVLEHGGKQLRPVLSLLMAKACGDGTVTEDSIRYAAAAELLHNATLLHDDVADGSEIRRGVPTVSSVLTPTHSVLIGDYWLAKAVGLVMDANTPVEEVFSLFSNTLILLAEGEMFQLQKAESGDTTEADYLRIIKSKTGSLFETACVAAAVSVKAPQEYCDIASEYARCLGIAFQIKDDILDYAGGEIGKPVGVDIREQKITMPLLSALERADAVRGERIRALVRQMPEHPENAGLVMDFVREYDGIAGAQKRLEEYSGRAAETVLALPCSTARDYLVQLADFTASRDK